MRTPLRTGIALAIAACAQRESEPPVARRQVADTTFVHNQAPEYADTASLRAVVRIGQVEGPDEYTFRDVRSLAVNADGHVFVSDLNAPLREYDADGRYVRTLARPGKGPGEVEYVTGMAVAADGRLVVRDVENLRVGIWRPWGTLEAEWRTMVPGRPSYGHQALVATRDGGLWLGINPPLPTDGSPLAFPRPVFSGIDGQGRVTDTLYAPARFTERCPVLSTVAFRSGVFEDQRHTYVPKVTWAMDPNGRLIVGCPADYTFDFIAADGSVLRVSRAWTPLRASREERDAFKAAITIEQQESGYFTRWSWEGPDLPEERPAYRRLVPAQDGRIWIWPSQPTVPRTLPAERPPGYPPVIYQESTGGAFDVFTPDGRWVGTVRLPADFPYVPHPLTPDPIIRGDTLWGVTVDSLEVQYVTRFQVAWTR